MAVDWHLFGLLLSLLYAVGSCKQLHVHDESLINTVGKFTCQPGKLYKSAMPKGIANVNVDHLKALGTAITAEECLSRCCDLGKERCQYLWVFKEACFSVGCDDSSIGCLPQLLPIGVKIDSIYVKMQYVAMETDLDDVEKLLDNQLEDKSRKKGGINEKGRPPVADAGGNMTVLLPVDVVHLYGNGSKSDKGIKSYLWQLISDHFVHPILENSNTPILQIRNLIPGNYTFRLTVTDPDDRSSSASVVVHVLEGQEAKATSPPQTQPSPHTTVELTNDVTGPPANGSEVGVEGKDSEMKEGKNEAYYRKRKIVLKIVVPVLLSVASILTLSAVIVGLSACLCERNRRRMRRFYRYKRIPETLEKT